CGLRHEITVKVDPIDQRPVIDHQTLEDRLVKNGTIVTLHWPVSASSILTGAKARFLQIAADYAFLNPHLTLHIDWFGECTTFVAGNPKWKKWLPSKPTSAHWYTPDRLERLIAAYIREDERKGRDRTIRETELAATYPLHVVCAWIGNTATIAQKHY